jgi:hypothetical protein
MRRIVVAPIELMKKSGGDLGYDQDEDQIRALVARPGETLNVEIKRWTIYAAALSSLSAPRITIFSASSGRAASAHAFGNRFCPPGLALARHGNREFEK